MRVALLPYAPVDRPNGVNRYINALTNAIPETDVVVPPGSSKVIQRLRERRGKRPRRALTQLDDYDIVHVPYERLRPGVVRRDHTVAATVMGLGGLSGANPDPAALRPDTAFVEEMQRLDDVTFITPSRATRSVLCDLVGIAPSSVTVIPLGVEHQIFHLGETSATTPRARLTDRPYLLHVGPYSVRKNSRLLLDAFEASRRDHAIPHALVWVGPVDDQQLLGAAEALGLADDVVIAGRLSDEALADAYRGATALCVPSRYEGFGLPVLEAMACGTPVIISDSPALVEVAGDAAMVACTASGPDVFAAAIGDVVSSTNLQQRLRACGLARASSFSWATCAAQHAELYRKLIDRSGTSGRYSPPPR